MLVSLGNFYYNFYKSKLLNQTRGFVSLKLLMTSDAYRKEIIISNSENNSTYIISHDFILNLNCSGVSNATWCNIVDDTNVKCKYAICNVTNSHLRILIWQRIIVWIISVMAFLFWWNHIVFSWVRTIFLNFLTRNKCSNTS